MPYPHGLTAGGDATRDIFRQQNSPDRTCHGGCEIDVNRAIRLHITRRIEWTNKGGARRGGQVSGDEITYAHFLRWNRVAGDTHAGADHADAPARAHRDRLGACKGGLHIEHQAITTSSRWEGRNYKGDNST